MSEFIVIQDMQIQEIGIEGIHYVDTKGETQFIDFMLCYANYLHARLNREAYLRFQELNSGMNIDFSAYIERYLKFRQVGTRNSLGYMGSYEGTGKPYMTFYTELITVIEFDNMDKYEEIWKETRRNSWRLFDET